MNRYQTKLFNLDESVDGKHIVRIVDRFADTLDFGVLGFDKAACAACPKREDCLSKKEKYRKIHRGPYADVYDRADARYRENAELYKTRQQIVEHVFGTVKRTMNGGYFLLRTKDKVKCEAALLFLGYNIKRSFGALGFDVMMMKLDEYAAKTGVSGAYFIVCFAAYQLRAIGKPISLRKRGFALGMKAIA